MNPKVSVFLPILLRTDRDFVMTKACINLMRAMTEITFELVIVETSSRMCEHLADVYIHQQNNPGLVVTHNRGWRACRNDLRGLISNDVYVTVGWLEALHECFLAKPDCGAATIAACELGQKKRDEISEGLYTPCSLWYKDYAVFDDRYIGGTWNDADMVMNMYVQGKKMYRNFKSMAHHLWNQTIKQDEQYKVDWENNRRKFIDKWKGYSDNWAYKALTEGWIV